MKRNDYIILASITIVVLLMLVIKGVNHNITGKYVKITESGVTIGIYPLNTDTTIELSGNTINISGGKVTMADADCPDRLCMKQQSVSKLGEAIVCLPNKVVVEVTDDVAPLSKTDFYFDTVVSVTLYDCTDSSVLDGVFDICRQYENICSRTSHDSELYKLNNRLLPTLSNNNTRYLISQELYSMIEAGIRYGEISGGSFDISIAPATSLWDFKSNEASIPDDELLADALTHVSYQRIHLHPDCSISFDDNKATIDLGGLAKGYIADRIREYLLQNNVHSATIALGGNIVCIGDKLGEPFVIGIQKPFDLQGKAITTIEECDKSVVTSGIYERYFEKEGTIYHHLLNPATGYPIDNDLASVTVISDSSLDGDCLSTYLFSLGLDKGLEYAKAHDDIEVIFVDKDNKIHTAR